MSFHFSLRLFLHVWDVAVMIVEGTGRSHLQDPSLITMDIEIVETYFGQRVSRE